MKRCLITATLFLFAATFSFAQSSARSESTFGKTQLFQVIILTGTTEGPDELKGLPKNAEKAIQDIRNFLPYKRYVLVDSALLRMGSHGDPGRTSLRGKIDTAEVEFGARMSYRELENRISVDHFELTRTDPRPPHSVLETSFGLVPGETVVVGTSKLNGSGKALIVLVTAVPTS